MKRNTIDLILQTKNDLKSISIWVAAAGVLLGMYSIWHHIHTIENDIDYRELLSVMIGTLTTIVVTTYSLTIVALQLASVQFSPRILRWFLTEDKFNQFVLGAFIGEISYLMLLKSWAPKNLDVPIVVGIVIGILLICVVFPLFIAHIADSINAGGISRRIAFNLLDEIDNIYGKNSTTETTDTTEVTVPKQSVFYLYATQNGYIESINYQQFDNIFTIVKQSASAKNISVTALYQIAMIGEFVGEGAPLFAISYSGTISESDSAFLSQHPSVQNAILKAIYVAKYRSYRQDINFGIRQLVDIAIKAISPAVNDPTTCINVLDYLGIVLRRLSQCPNKSLIVSQLPSHIYAKEFGFREFVDHSFDQIYHFGQQDFIVVTRVLRILRSVVHTTNNAQYISILEKEFLDIKNDVLLLKDSFTPEGFSKIVQEIEACELAFAK